MIKTFEVSETSKVCADWRDSGAAERANYQLFLSELCDVLEVARPQPTSSDAISHVFCRFRTSGEE